MINPTNNSCLNFNEIIYLESDSNYTIFHLSNGQRQLSSRHMGFHLMHTMSGNFVRIHRRYSINKLYINRYDYKNEPENIVLANGTALSVSRRLRTTLKKYLSKT